MFTVSATRPGASGTGAYVWADQPTAGSYTPDPRRQFNVTGAVNTVQRITAGMYRVSLPGLGAEAGHVQVTGYGDRGWWCKTGGWGPSGADPTVQTVYVLCFSPAGTPVDSSFTMTYVRDTDVLLAPPGRYKSAYAWAWDPTTDGYRTAPPYTHDPVGGTGTVINRPGPGRYRVHFPLSLDAGLAHVTAYGWGNERCALALWSTALGVDVTCHLPTGTPVDTRYDVAFAT
jgi:hypothetical protein